MCQVSGVGITRVAGSGGACDERAQTTHDHRQTVGHGLDVAPKYTTTKPHWKKEEPQDIINLSKPTYQGNQGLGRLKGNDATISRDIARGMWATQEWGKKIGMDQVGERRHGIPHSQPTHPSLGPTNVEMATRGETRSTGRGRRAQGAYQGSQGEDHLPQHGPAKTHTHTDKHKHPEVVRTER